jgi:DMSO reductase family type II enzyme heme b subunit
VQLPPTSTDGERPYFLGGSTRRPAHVWRWTSEPDGVDEGVTTGLGTFMPRSGTPQVTHGARFADGEWRLQLTRALVPADTTTAPTLPVGRAIPIAFFAGDGSNGEDEVRGAVSAWYALYLDVPRSSRVYVAPLSAMVLTAGLGILVVRNARRRGRHPERSTPEEQ